MLHKVRAMRKQPHFEHLPSIVILARGCRAKNPGHFACSIVTVAINVSASTRPFRVPSTRATLAQDDRGGKRAQGCCYGLCVAGELKMRSILAVCGVIARATAM